MMRQATSEDCADIAQIYNHYIQHTIVTFEEQEVSAKEMRSRLESVESEGLPWLVAEVDGRVAGYAYATRWSARAGYRFTAEVTVYLRPDATGRGLGSKLYKRLFGELQQRSYRRAIGGVALPNPPSVALHEKLGMEKVAHFKKVGVKFGRWIDVGYWQVNLDSLQDKGDRPAPAVS